MSDGRLWEPRPCEDKGAVILLLVGPGGGRDTWHTQAFGVSVAPALTESHLLTSDECCVGRHCEVCHGLKGANSSPLAEIHEAAEEGNFFNGSWGVLGGIRGLLVLCCPELSLLIDVQSTWTSGLLLSP